MNDTRITVKDNMVVTLDYTLRVDGEVVDSSEDSKPIQFIQGQGQIIPGLETNLYGMSIGETKKVVVPPEQGYGTIDEEAFAEIPKKEFPKNIPLEPGIALQLRDEDGEVVDAYIAEVAKDIVRLNFNHPLAGKDLQFNIEVVDLRDATEEEIAHGHVHDQEEGELDEDELDEEDFDEEEAWEDEEEEIEDLEGGYTDELEEIDDFDEDELDEFDEFDDLEDDEDY